MATNVMAYALVLLKVCDLSTVSGTYYFRPYGDYTYTDTSNINVVSAPSYSGCGMAIVETDSSGRLQWSSSGGQSTRVYLLGYIK